MGTATPRVWKLREMQQHTPGGSQTPGRFCAPVSRENASLAVDRLRKVYPCREVKRLGRSGRQGPRNPAEGKKRSPPRKVDFFSRSRAPGKGGVLTHPNGPGLAIIAQMFENVKPLRHKKRSGKVKGAPR